MEGNFFIPAEFLSRFSKDGNIESIERELMQALSSSMPDDTKHKLFQNTMYRYQQHQDQLKRPIEAKFTLPPQAPLPQPVTPPLSPLVTPQLPPIVTPKPPPKFQLDDSLDDYSTPSPPHAVDLSFLPRTKQDKASAMMNYVQKNQDFGIDETGQISYKGKSVEGSNIVDLINDFSRNHKQKPVKGAEVFAAALRESNVPLSFIENKNRHSMLSPGARLFRQAIDKWKPY